MRTTTEFMSASLNQAQAPTVKDMIFRPLHSDQSLQHKVELAVLCMLMF